MDELVKCNLRLMWSHGDGGMQDLLDRESVGGNAGMVKVDGVDYSCGFAVFGCVANGKIVYFNETPYDCLMGGFRVALQKCLVEGPRWFRIVGTYFPVGLSEEGIRRIGECVNFYNNGVGYE